MSSIARKRRRGNVSNNRKDLPQQKIIKTAENFVKSVGNLDFSITKKLSVCANKKSAFGHLRPLMKTLEISCHGIPWILVTVILIGILHKSSDLQILLNILIGLVGDLIVVGFLKFLVQRPRPLFNEKDMFATVSVDHYSFPSGHSTRAAMMAFTLAEKLVVNSTFPGLMYLWSLFVTMSRVMLGRHYFSDIAFGYGIGILEYYVLCKYWLSEEMTMSLLEPISSYLHH